ncbi:hypothetical protein Cantr_09199 [Candida viswanathii]|uniref:Uncharacterized protein n=1 Tax=Candida viswanathii TaxID=5486 RepID=A0A367YBB6_9ASCO|nr:hypothetical protein Cantr_09199 [Candida viswanathii]
MTTQNTKTITAHSRIGVDSTDKNFTKIITFKTNDEQKLPTTMPFLQSSLPYPRATPDNNPCDEASKIDQLGRKLIGRLDALGLISKDVSYSSDESDTSFSDAGSWSSVGAANGSTASGSGSSNGEVIGHNGDSRKRKASDGSENGADSESKIYNCKINLEMFQGDEKFSVDLHFLYHLKDMSHGTSSNGGVNGSFMELPPNLYITFEELINYLRDKIFLSGVSKNLHGIETKINILLKLKSFRCFINDQEFKLPRHSS